MAVDHPYVDLETLRLQLKIEDDDPREILLERALSAACRSIDKTTGRRFWLDEEPVTRTYRSQGRVVRENDGDVLLVDDIGDADIMVTTGAGDPGSPVTGFETVPDNALADGRPVTGLLMTGGMWSWGTTGRVRVTARFGWPAVPEDIGEAALIQASRLYNRRNSPEGVTGSAEWGVVRLSRRDPDVWNLIEQYVLPGFG
ncbi:phage gp6-like head-tail connector protein [Streptomyces niveus]